MLCSIYLQVYMFEWKTALIPTGAEKVLGSKLNLNLLDV